ncbi:MAG: hypothetical protein JWR17_4268 [Pseudomonas sp.]|jgi:disulfide bond formation protein DsbB|uniref:disulfide bond formation protein B n=1 Tax=Pseudomonas sp. TaxID=306 RepID=UPI0026195913|nr:disulfide bond formation protein B [Pseudomonas sp.]MDB6051522.1 hypothetical protein [Pseudomonas sp.]
MHLAASRPLFFLAFIASTLVVGASLYLEYGVGLVPCSLCLVQRTLLIILGAVSLIAFFHAPTNATWRAYSIAMLLCAMAGALSAGRQVWMQTHSIERLLPCRSPSQCLTESTSIAHLLARLFDRTAECAEVSWSLFGMSAAEWSLLAFVGLVLIATYQVFQRAPVSLDVEKENVKASQD